MLLSRAAAADARSPASGVQRRDLTPASLKDEHRVRRRTPDLTPICARFDAMQI